MVDWKGEKVAIKIQDGNGKSTILRTVYDNVVRLDTDTLNDLFDQFPPSKGFWYTIHPVYNIILDHLSIK